MKNIRSTPYLGSWVFAQSQTGLDQCTVDCLDAEAYDCYYEYVIPVKSHFSLSLTPFPYE
jgi:hypothetical protein